MLDPVELELQLKVTDKNKFNELLADPVFRSGKFIKLPKRVAFETTYFDTATHRLQKNGFALRIRKSADGFMATVKNRGTDGGGLFTRNEWNRPALSNTPSVEAFEDLPVGKRLAEIVGVEALMPIFKTVVKRASARLSPEEGSEIELSADIGEITCQGRSEEICEIELELKNGPVRCIFTIAQELASRYPLLPEENSKYLRGLILAGLAADADEVEKPKAFHFGKHAGYLAISALLLDRLDDVTRAQGEFIQTPLSSKAIHQLRISVRTFRSLLYLLNPLMDPETCRSIQKEFGAYIRGFSKIRDYDVLMRTLDAHRLKYPDAAEETKEFMQWIQERRAEENHARHLECSAGAATPMLMHAKLFLLQFGEGQGAAAEDGIYTVVHSRFKKKLVKFKKDLKNTDFSDPKAVHALRIQCKKLNYSQQFLKGGKKDETKTGEYLKELQKVLGRICDIGSFLRIAEEFKAQNQGKELQDFIRLKTAERDVLQKKVIRLQP